MSGESRRTSRNGPFAQVHKVEGDDGEGGLGVAYDQELAGRPLLVDVLDGDKHVVKVLPQVAWELSQSSLHI